MAKTVRSLRTAPSHIKRWWSRTGLEAGLLHLVERGSTWEDAHERLKALYQRWWDCGRRGHNPLLRFSNLIICSRVRAMAAAGHPHRIVIMAGRPHISIEGYTLVRAL